MTWQSLLRYVVGIAGGLAAAVLLAVLVAVAIGGDSHGAIVVLWLVIPAWLGFSYFFSLQRELKRQMERILITLALEAFTLPLAGLLFVALLWLQTFEPIGEQTGVMGQATGLILGGLIVLLGTGLVALFFGGLSFLLFLLLKFNLVHVGRAIKLEAQRRIDQQQVAAAILAIVLGLSVSVGLAAVPGSPAALQPPGAPLPGVWTQPFYCPMVRAALFIADAERGVLGALFRFDRFTERVRTALGVSPGREDRVQRAARARLETYVFMTGNPNLRVGELHNVGGDIEGEIVTHSGELVERVRVDTRTGVLWAVR